MKKVICVIAFLFAASSPTVAQKSKDSAPPMQSRPFSKVQMLHFLRELHAKAAQWKTEADPLAPSWRDSYLAGQVVQIYLKGTKKDLNGILTLTSSSTLKSFFARPTSSAYELYYEFNLLGVLISANEDLNQLFDDGTEDANLEPRMIQLAHLRQAVASSRAELDEEVTLRIEELAYPPGTKKPRKGAE